MIDSKNKIYFKNIDFLRFVFSILIVIFHVSRIACAEVSQDPILNKILLHSDKMNVCVEFFFIISGFFFIVTLKPEKTMCQFISGKIKRLSPIMVYTVFGYFILSIFKVCEFYTFDNIFALLFINGIEIVSHSSPFGGLSNIHSSWYVSVLFWLLCLFFYIAKNYGNKALNLFLLIIIPISMYWRKNGFYQILPSGVVRGLYSISIGCILGQLYKKWHNRKEKYIVPQWLGGGVYTLLEVVTFGRLMLMLCFAEKFKSTMPDLLLMFVLLFSLFIIKRGLLSRLLENNFSKFLGTYSYSIFITHVVVLDVFKKFVFVPNSNTSYVVLFGLCVLASIVFGIFSHHLVNVIMYVCKEKLRKVI